MADPGISTLPNHEKRWPYWIGLDDQLFLKKGKVKGVLSDQIANYIHGHDNDGVYYGIVALQVTPNNYVTATISIRIFNFPINSTEILTQFGHIEIAKKAKQFIETGDGTVKADHVKHKVQKLFRNLTFSGCGGGGTQLNELGMSYHYKNGQWVLPE